MQSNTQVLQPRKFIKYLLYIFAIVTILSAVGGVSGRLPSNSQQQSTLGQDLTPNMSFFSSLPVHLIGETAEADGYAITLNQVIAQSENLALDITLTNNSAYEIDLNWAVKLYLPSGELVFPENQLQQEENILPIRGSLRRTWYYKFNDSMSKLETLSDWRLLYAPFGWSGPVILYRLSETVPEQRAAPHRQVAPSAYGSTGDPWKMLVLIYPNIDTDYVENGVSKHLTASMPAQDIENMKNDFLNLPHQNIVFSYSDGTAELESHVVVINRPLTNLEPINEGFWPSPDVTRQELDLYGPKDKYDSVIVFWQASNPSTGQSLPVYGWGLGYWPFDYANGMTYATVFNLSWVWPNDVCKGEVFLHEWLHGVTGFYMWRGYSFPFEDLHGAEEAGYVTDANGCWKNWLMDYMRGMVYEDGIRKALVPETWQGGSITTYDISGWRGEYFNNQNLSGIPVLVRDDPDVNFEWLLGSPHPFVLDDGFSGRWSRIIDFEEGDYKFDLFRDDGIRLKIDDVTVLENWQYGREWISLTKTMTAGPHTVQVEFYEVDGYSSAVFRYAKLLPDKFNKLDPLDFSTVQMLTPTLHWNESVGATSYEYCLDAGNVDEICNSGWISTGMNTYAVLQTPLSDDVTYHWQVRARNERGTIVSDEGWWTFNVQLAAPSVPNNLVTKNTTSNSVIIGWDDTEYETGYKIYKWGPNASGVWGFYYYAALAQNATTFTDINLDCNASYWYEVSAFNSHGESPHAGWVVANTLACGGGVPTVSSITRASANPTNRAKVNFTVIFSRSVTAVDIGDFSLTTSGVSGAAVSGVSGSGSIYAVTVSTGSGNGTIRLNVVDDDTIKDAAGNPLGGVGPGNGNFADGEIYTVIKSVTFNDVPGDYWAYSYIERLYNAGVTGGCSVTPLNYCPDNTVTRAQMAVFLLKGMHGSSYTPPAVGTSTGFSDVTTDYWAAAWIKQLAAEGITGGCGTGVYCPDSTVTRAQMAVFLLRAKHGSSYSPPNATGVFTDVPVGYWADKWIEQLATEGITGGCGTGVYCPDSSVTRAQMAVFLVKTFNLP